MRKSKLFLCMAMCLAVLAGCSKSPAEVPKDDTVAEKPIGTFTYGKYYGIMTRSFKDGNAIISPESTNIAISLYSELLNEEDKAELQGWLEGRQYLSYKENDGFKSISRIWANENRELNFSGRQLDDYLYEISMNDPEAATSEKDKYVSESTDGFITFTPTAFEQNTDMDIMNVLYFNDVWEGPDKELDIKPTAFVNENGTETDVVMFRDHGDSVKYTYSAHQYTMRYSNGFELNVILPDEGYNIGVIDIDKFIDGDVEILDADVEFAMPEFEAQSVYTIGLGAFDLKPYMVDSKIGSGIILPIPQVAKVKVDHRGTIGEDIDEGIDEEAIDEEELQSMEPLTQEQVSGNNEVPEEVRKPKQAKEKYEMVCDRPFVYYIRDTLNDDIAFIGRVTDMSE